MSKPVILVSYWPAPEGSHSIANFIRHTSHAEAAQIADYQDDPRAAGPSACVWMVPATNPEDPEYERSPALERPARIRGAAYWLGEVPKTRHFYIGCSGAPGYVMLYFFSFTEGALSIGQSQGVLLENLPAELEALKRNGWTRASYRYTMGRPELVPHVNA